MIAYCTEGFSTATTTTGSDTWDEIGTSTDAFWVIIDDGYCDRYPDPIPYPKNWRWYDIFRIWVEPVYRKQKMIVQTMARRVQERLNNVQRRHNKRRMRMQKLLA